MNRFVLAIGLFGALSVLCLAVLALSQMTCNGCPVPGTRSEG